MTEIQEAVMALSQSEKIKAGLVWVSQTLEIAHALPPGEKQGAEKIIRVMTQMISDEANLARRVTADPAWKDVQKHIEKALVMIRSGVPQEASFHLTRALPQVTAIGQRAMSFLKEQGML